MARILAVEWDNGEFRFVLGFISQDRLTVLKAESAPIEGEGPEAVISAFGKLMRENRIGKVRTILGLNRSQVEVHHLTLPPASDEELPELIKNQIIRDSSAFTEGSPIDFLPLNDASAGPRKVMAAFMSRSNLRTYRSIFRATGKQLARIELKTVALNELLGQTSLAQDSEPVLVLSLGLEDADILIRYNKLIVAIRSFRLSESADPGEMFKRVAVEVTRTIAVGAPEAFDEPIRKVVIFGTEEEASQIGEHLSDPTLEVHPVDPFSMEKVRAKDRPLSPGKYAPMIGMLFNERVSLRPAIDLLAPKEKPKPPNYTRMAVLVILLLIIAGAGLHFWNKRAIARKEDEFARLEKEYKDTSDAIREMYPEFAVSEYARDWSTRNPAWLDELREISILFPDARDIVVTEMSFAGMPESNRDRRYSGTIRFSGLVRDPIVLRQLQATLRAKRFYLMEIPSITSNPAGGGYPYRFQDARIFCLQRTDKRTYLYSLSPEAQKDSYNYPEYFTMPQTQQQKPVEPQPAEPQPAEPQPTEPQPEEPQPEQSPPT